jgi:hypothetical protein
VEREGGVQLTFFYKGSFEREVDVNDIDYIYQRVGIPQRISRYNTSESINLTVYPSIQPEIQVIV